MSKKFFNRICSIIFLFETTWLKALIFGILLHVEVNGFTWPLTFFSDERPRALWALLFWDCISPIQVDKMNTHTLICQLSLIFIYMDTANIAWTNCFVSNRTNAGVVCVCRSARKIAASSTGLQTNTLYVSVKPVYNNRYGF